MKRLALGLFLVVAASLWAVLPVSDAFTDTNGVTLETHNAGWTVVVGGFDIYTNSLRQTADGRGLARWTGETFSDNQYVECVLAVASASSQIGIAARIATNGDVTAYVAQWNDTNIHLAKLVTGTWTQLAIATVPAVGSIVRLEPNGTTIRVLDDAVEIMSVTDSAISSGVAGVAGWYNWGSRLDSWAAGNISAGGARRRVVIAQ